ncbi:hypothetical protein QFC19_001775 [Naganishia cerealis]|uniref:Uncharacterized protein n=1 Tax=Naganishia cerealis TaxID=610337 RepID=A0ACC2WFW4_9TREE|nr:hypothetical protein QFC19_001775 [Naganishia cerealis]
MFFNDRICEMFLGAWRTYTSILYDANEAVSDPSSTATPRSVMDRVPEIARLIFAHVSSDTLFDHAGLNKWFFETCFPKAEWEFERDWQRRAVGGKWYRFDNVIIADRRSGHMGGGVSKPMDLAFKLPVPERWLTDLKDRILANYAGPVSIVDPSHMLSRPVITYISRQTAAHRRLKGEIHEQLVAELQTLEQDRIAEVHIEEFTDADSKDEQVAKLSRTTILIGLHGNGLTNLIWMTPDPRGRSTVYEIQQKGLFIDDYAVLSEALGIKHWIIGGRTDSE